MTKRKRDDKNDSVDDARKKKGVAQPRPGVGAGPVAPESGTGEATNLATQKKRKNLDAHFTNKPFKKRRVVITGQAKETTDMTTQASGSPQAGPSLANPTSETAEREIEDTRGAHDADTTTDAKLKPRYTINKLAPMRPFPSVAKSESATGPKSAHKRGLNLICVTRKTPLGFYIKRCREVFMKHNYKWLHLHALGAAIPHLVLLASSLPQTLPFPASEISTSVRTLTVECRDEILPDDEDEDINYRIRGKSALSVIIKVGDAPLPDDVYGGVDYLAGEDGKEPAASEGLTKGKAGKKGSGVRREKGRRKRDNPETARTDVTMGDAGNSTDANDQAFILVREGSQEDEQDQLLAA